MAFVPGTAALPRAVGAPVGGPGAMDVSESGGIGAAPVLGSYIDPKTGLRRSARLELKKTAVDALTVAGPALPADILSYLPGPGEASMGGLRRRAYRGGALSDEQKNGLAAITTAALVAAAVAYQFGTDGLVAGYAASGGAIALLASVSEGKTKAAGEAIAAHLKKRGAGRIAESVGRLGVQAISLLDNGLGLAFAMLRLPISAATAVTGITGQLISKGATTLQAISDKLEKPETHEEQANLIIQNGTLAFAAALAALAASGALPLMTIFSVMLWTGKLYTSPVGRAVAVVELYMWWINNPGKHAAIAKEVKEYTAAAKSGAGKAKDWVEKTGAPELKNLLGAVGAKVGVAGERFVEGLKEGSAMENPVASALSLGFLRAAGLALDPSAPAPKEEENADDLGKLAANILDNAIKLGPGGTPTAIDVGKLEEVVTRLTALAGAQKEVSDLRVKLAAAKDVREVALKKVTDPEEGELGPVASAVPEAARAAKASKSVGERRERVGPKAAASSSESPAASTQKAKAALREARAVASPSGRVRKAVEAAGAPEGGRRRKTRRKRMVRRITKKVKDFYY